MSGTEDADKIKAHCEFIEFLNKNVRESEESAQRLRKKFQKWENTRNNTIKLIQGSVYIIMKAQNNLDPVQTICKIGSAGGKIATFFGPAACVLGAMTSLASDGLYAFVSAGKIDVFQKISAAILEALDEDGELTAQLYEEMGKMSRNHLKMKDCIKKIHAATVTGFFDNVPSLKNFVNAVRTIEDVESPKGMEEFLLALWESATEVAKDPNLYPSLTRLLKYNPDVLNILVATPEIIVNGGILAVGGMPAGMAGRAVRGLNALGIIVDIYDIVTNIRNITSDTYPKIAEELLKIKGELEKGKERIKEIEKEFNGRK